MEEEISLIEIGQTLAKHWKLLFILPLLTAVITYGVTVYLVVPRYESTATLIVMPFTERLEDSDVVRHDIASTQQVVQSCKELTLSLESMQNVIRELGLPYTSKELVDNIKIEVDDVTSISVTDPSPERAYQIANHVTEVLMEYITEFARLENVQLLNPAQIPERPVNQRFLTNMAIAYVLAFMISIALAFLFEHLDNTIKTSDDVQNILGVPVLGVIPDFDEEAKR